MGYQTVPFLLLLLLMFIGYICPYFILFFPPFAVYGGIAIVLNVSIRLILACKYKDPMIAILLHPLAIFLTILIGCNSLYTYKRGNLKWKGRKIIFDKPI
jgi:hypothetical protein